MIYTVTQQKSIILPDGGDRRGEHVDGKWSYNRDKLQFAIVESQSWMSKKVKQ